MYSVYTSMILSPKKLTPYSLFLDEEISKVEDEFVSCF